MHLEPDPTRYLANDLNGDAGHVPHALGGAGGVCEGALNEGEAAARRLKQRNGTVPVLDSSRADLQGRSPAIGVHRRVPLATLDLLACVVAARAACLGGFHALTVDHRSAGTGLTPDALAVKHDQPMIDRLPHARTPPGERGWLPPEPVPSPAPAPPAPAKPRGEVLWLTAAAARQRWWQVLDAVEARAEVIVTRRDWPALKLQPATAEAALARRVHGKPAPG